MIEADMPNKLKNSTAEQEVLRATALWAADFAEQALPVFESRHANDARPREAIEAGREYGQGKRRDKNLRVLALAAFKIGKNVDEPSKYVTQAAALTAAVAYTHTDLQTGMQGVRQAQHVLGPIVYAALALETAAGGEPIIGDDVIHHALKSAPSSVRYILKHMPPQPKKDGRLNSLFFDLDSGLRNEKQAIERS
jgi:hypothetical protein